MYGPVLLLLLAAHPSEAAQKYRSPDARRDWHGMAWGTRAPSDMKCTPGEFADLKVCTRAPTTGDRAIGELTADQVEYIYFQERLYRVEVAFNSDDVATELSTVLHSVYGPGAWDASEGKETWTGSSISIGWSRNLRKTGATLTYQFDPFVGDLEAARSKAGGERMANIGKDL